MISIRPIIGIDDWTLRIPHDIDEPGIAPDFHDDALDRFVFMTGH